MNLKRMLGFGVMLWILIFVEISIVMFIPGLVGKEMWQNVIHWILLIPITLLLCKWYFKADAPTMKKGLILGVVALLTGTVLDMVITVPLFVKSFSAFYGNWILYIGFVELLILTTFAGGEFDGTYTKRSE